MKRVRRLVLKCRQREGSHNGGVCVWGCSQSLEVWGFQSPRDATPYVFIRPLFISICMYVFIYIDKVMNIYVLLQALDEVETVEDSAHHLID
jgi:hypothetical protein